MQKIQCIINKIYLLEQTLKIKIHTKNLIIKQNLLVNLHVHIFKNSIVIVRIHQYNTC